ncbi:MFS transporter [Jannaschia sp. R86511]|uniref:MFS transporter n=1 Tax=Jannaschia sp. R86511 TaxID=3093853 RepID=UPI0036D27504
MSADFSLRPIALSAFGPALLFGIGQGAVYPVIALSARELGASVGVAAFVVALVGIGQVLGDLPAGALAARVGDRRAMVGASVVTAVALAGCVLAPSVPVLGLAVLLTGLAGAVFGLARQSYLTEAVPVRMRARAMSTLGGTHRIGTFVGPFLGALVTSRYGVDGAYLLFLLTAVGAAVLVLVVPDVPRLGAARPAPGTATPSVLSVTRAHLGVLRTLGVAALLVMAVRQSRQIVMAVRQSRQIVLPLWGEQLGLDVATISLVMGVSGAVDMLLFYPAGSVMDRHGRAWVGVPSMLVLGLAHAVLPLAGSLPGLLGVAVLMGVGNGMGAGLVMTLGADTSPDVGRQAYLGAWRLVSDVGMAGGPLVVGGVAAATALGPASLSVAVVALLAAGALARWVPPRRRDADLPQDHLTP